MELFKLLGTIAIDNSAANSAIDSTTSKANNSEGIMSGAFKKIGAAVAAYFTTAAIINFGKDCMTAASQAETSFAKVNTLLSDGTNTSGYFDDIKKASSETGVAVSDFSEAVYSAISASVDQADAVEFTTSAVKLAKGGFTDTTTAVDVLTTAMNAYGPAAGTAEEISDKLITTQNLGKTTVDELASSMGKIIPTANSYGVGIDTLCGSYAEMTKNGIDTAESTTYMNSMLNELGKSGTTASDVLKDKTGQSFKELMDSGYSLTDVLGILQSSADNSGKSLGDMFGSAEAGKAAVVLQNNATDLDSCISAMGESSGATEKAYSTMSDTMSEKVQVMKNKFDLLKIAVGDQLAPAVENIVTKLSEFADFLNTSVVPAMQSMGEWCSNNKTTIQLLGIGVAALTAALVANNAINAIRAAGIAAATTAEGAQAIMMGTSTLALGAHTIATGIATAATTAFGAAVAFLTSPITLVIAAIAAVIAIGVLLYQNWDTIKEKAAELGENIKGKWEDLKASASEKFEAVKQTISDAIDIAKQNTQQTLSEMKQAYDENGGGIKGSMAAAMAGIHSNMSQTYESLNTITHGKLGQLVSTISTELNDAKEKATEIFTNIKKAITDKIQDAKDTVTKVIGKIKEAFHFEWSLPKLKLPHLNISGKFSIDPPSVPKFGIEWYKKAMDNPMLMTKPTAFGINGHGQVMAGGEAGDEVVSGKNTLMGMIAEAVAAQNAGLVDSLNQILAAIVSMDRNMGGNLSEAIDGASLSINNREFARLVKAVN